MKNIHILPTDKPSRLLKTIPKANLILSKSITSGSHWENQNIYITNSEEIKEGDWYLTFLSNEVIGQPRKCEDTNWDFSFCKKIILTTDQDLIKDGVQVIDDEFLEWFVKNPSCEKIDVNDWMDINGNIAFGGNTRYQIIIPQEEPKNVILGYKTSLIAQKLDKVEIDWLGFPKSTQEQVGYIESKEECTCENPTDNTCDYCEEENKKEILEEAKKRALEGETLEEAAEREYPKEGEDSIYCDLGLIQQDAFKLGAKWQAERMYSEEEVLEILEHHTKYLETFIYQYIDKNDMEENKIWFEQFKKNNEKN